MGVDTREAAAFGKADVCWRMRMLTCADVCRREAAAFVKAQTLAASKNKLKDT